MDLESHLINKQSPELDAPLLNKEKDQLSTDDEDPYGFNSTSANNGIPSITNTIAKPIKEVEVLSKL